MPLAIFFLLNGKDIYKHKKKPAKKAVEDTPKEPPKRRSKSHG